ncbi:lipoprotein-releasing system ATP-binding protein [Desulfocicer vacuolatum DSM 3385]|uniref:Lipoprotein-releasing system ATP-binding protein n=1 Tax=Desulfocicer vacuolatum DSM 3385 TaxID=1121400 RepID=A0A1W1ZLR0_9BACT|nr:ABC transporter ATP-binding protein [Desulfocicer vacuolatum]SMC49324.1 lipoprotein-releasing system ATP-binding protein [Desulfocicer vacuolatum DSM 3385]
MGEIKDNILVSLQGMSKAFKTADATIDILKDVDFDICQGESMAVVGASGIGKSTLLHLVGTLDRPDTGSIRFWGNDVLTLDERALARFRNRTIGFVFQFHHLLQGFTTLENVMIPCLIDEKSSEKATSMATEMLDRVGLGHRLAHRVEDLSGGEQQRVAIARALVTSPSLLLADEPTGNLDKKNSRAVHQLLLELNKELGMTLIVVTHNPELADIMQRQVTLRQCRVVPA